MLNTSETAVKIFAALVNFNKTFKGLVLDASNPFFKSNYISFDSIVGLRGELAKVGIAIVQPVSTTADGLSSVIQTYLVHESGEWMCSEPLILKPVKADPQGLGSALTYGKRYQLAAMLGIAEKTDDDANAASGLTNTAPAQANFNQNSAPKTQPKPQAQAPAQTPAPANPDMMNAEQASRMTTALKAKGLTRDQALKICKDLTKKESASELTHDEAEVVIKAYENYKG